MASDAPSGSSRWNRQAVETFGVTRIRTPSTTIVPTYDVARTLHSSGRTVGTTTSRCWASVRIRRSCDAVIVTVASPYSARVTVVAPLRVSVWVDTRRRLVVGLGGGAAGELGGIALSDGRP